MHSNNDLSYSLPVSAVAPIELLARRRLQVSFPLPRPLLRALGTGELPDSTMWSSWLAEWGWAWAISSDTCNPRIPLVNLWLHRSAWPRGFDSRVLALAVALKIRVNGEPLSTAMGQVSSDLGRVWSTVLSLSHAHLGEILALALLRADVAVFNFDSTAPSWPSDVSRVTAERRNLLVERSPSPTWLISGYALLGDGFNMLRSMGSTLAECQEIWSDIAPGLVLPVAFEMAFWWEAAYCFTDRHEYEAAESAQCRVAQCAESLEGMTGLVDPMWHHQQGRLYYYAGNFELALAEFLREYRVHGDDLTVAAMLNREVANVLSDMVCLEAAQRFAERSVAVAKSQGQHAELYKSLGRMAEICIKRGDLERAGRALNDSLSIQEKTQEDTSSAQTMTYLGHLTVLKGEFDGARTWYDLADASDINRYSLPYIAMGRFSLAVITGNTVEMDDLWGKYRDELKKWTNHQTHILPAAVCTTAAALTIPAARDRVSSIMHFLVERHYVVEAAYALVVLGETNQLITKEIVSTLRRWQKTLGSIPQELREIAGPLNGPTMMIERITRGEFRVSNEERFVHYPMALLNSPELTNRSKPQA